jgi:hypothetical protein
VTPTGNLEVSSKSKVNTGHPAFSTNAIADTGSTANFCTVCMPVINKRVAIHPIAIRNPNGSVMYSTHEAELDIPGLPDAARHVHIVPDLASKSLISIGQLCDAGCKVTFDATDVTVYHDDKIALTGKRTSYTRLWHLDIPEKNNANSLSHCDSNDVKYACNAAIGSATAAELVAFSHAALYSPALSTLEQALEREFLTSFPGLTKKSLRKHPPQSIPMVKGHLDQSRQNIKSTKPKPPKAKPTKPTVPTPINNVSDEDKDFFPDQEKDFKRTHDCFTAIMETTGQIYTDQTGRFVCPSSSGNNYIMICYDYDSNSILAEPLKDRKAKSILAAYKKIHARLCKAGLRPRLQRLDNECSEALKEFMHSKEVDFQLVPPGIHRRNAAERAIRTWKNHFIAGLCSLDKNFPLHLWDTLLPQAELTLNLLRGSRINPKLSAYAQLNGQFDFNRTPLAPPGIRVLIHEKPDKRTSWSPHALDGWYTGPALDSYRCFRIWAWDTRAERICDTLSWFPTKVTMPIASSNDLILAGIQDIVSALQNPSPGSALAPLTDSHVEALLTLTEILTGVARATPPIPTVNKPSDNIPSPPLRVEAVPAPAPALRVTNPIRVPTLAEPSAPPLRVENIPTPNRTLTFADAVRTPSATPDTVPELAPVNPPDASPTTEPIIAPNTTPTATPTAAPTIEPDATFDDSTGPNGRKRRRNNRRGNQKSKTKTPGTKNKSHSKKATSASPARAPPTHQHGTRSRTGIQHVAATAEEALYLAECENMRSAGIMIDNHYALHGNAINPDTGLVASYDELAKSSEGPLWVEGCADEMGRLFRGRGKDSSMPTGTETLFAIPFHMIPKHKKATYLRVVAAFRPEKDNPHRVRFTAGGDRIDYAGDVSTKTADMTTIKIHLNSVLSTRRARYMTGDLKDFYLNTPMEEYEYIRIPVSVIPESIMIEYDLAGLVHNGAVYCEIRKGMYGLPQAGRIANDRLTKFLEPHGYTPVAVTPGLWKHHTKDITFTLVVDDFGVKYTDKKDAEHLMACLKENYVVKEDWEGTRYCGLTIEWDYTRRLCYISMPGYIARCLQRFAHLVSKTPTHSPHAYTPPTYGRKVQYADGPDESPQLDPNGITRVQEILGTLLYYARAVDGTLLVTIGNLATQQSKATTTTMNGITHLLNYCATHPDAVVRYSASDMILTTDSDASYLTAPKARSRAAGYHYLSDMPKLVPKADDPMPRTNGAVNILCQIMREVLSSAAEAELAALFHNCKEACPMRTTLEEMGHPQPATPMVTDNSTASGIANDSVKQKRSKAIDMRFYWVRDRVRQGQFNIYWKKGALNQADYYSKCHPTSHHRQVRSSYLYDAKDPNKNYFECLQDNDTNTKALDTTRDANLQTPGNQCEGVLISGNPETPATRKQSTDPSS